MAFPVYLLTSRAQCQLVLTALRQELRVFTVQDQVLDLRADQANDRAADRATILADQQDTVARLTPMVAALTPGTPEHTLTNRLLVRATRRIEDLTGGPASAADPVAAVLKAVDVAQVAVQLPVLERAIAEVEQHEATLPI